VNILMETIKKYKYYEIVCTDTVIGVTSASDDEEGLDDLLYTSKQDRVTSFGEITEEEFNYFSDHDWTKPRSKKQYKIKIKPILELIE